MHIVQAELRVCLFMFSSVYVVLV